MKRVLLSLLLLAVPAFSALGDDDEGPERFASPLNFALELRYGAVKYDQVFPAPASQSAASVLFEWLPLTRWGKLGLGLGITHVFPRNTDVLGSTLSVQVDAVDVGLSYRADILPGQYVVPLVRVARAFQLPFTRTDGAGVKGETQQATELSLGAAVLLDWIEPKSAANLDREIGINNVYLVAEYVKSSTSGEALDLSHSGFRVNFRLEF